MKVSALLIICPTLVSSFSVIHQTTQRSRLVTEIGMAKGFDASSKPEPRKKTAAQTQREKASSQYDTIAAQGGQEYAIFVRQFGGDDESWLPCGSIAVPRGSQVSDAIFGNEQPLMEAIVRTFPKLKGFENEFEYGYNLQIYPDDPVEIAKKESRDSGMSVGNWISNLLSPIDDSQAKPPPSV